MSARRKHRIMADLLPSVGFAGREPGAIEEGHRLKVCMLAACPFPANHGTPGSIREMAEAVSELGHEVHIVTYHYGEDIPVRGPQLHRITPLLAEQRIVVGPTIRRPLYDLQMIVKAIQVIREHRPAVLHAHGYEAGLVAWVCRLLTGLPVVYSGHNTMIDELPSYQFIRPPWLARALARVLDILVPRCGDRCLPHSTNLERFFHEQGLRSRTEPVVHFGVDLDWMARGDGKAIRQRYELGSGPVMLYTGVLDRFQRLDLLLEAMALVTWFVPQAKLLIVVTVPNPAHEAAVRAKAQELKIDRHVILTEPQPLAAVRDFLQVCDVAVAPRPQTPGFPIKLINYMAAAKPCVLFASSASGDLVDRENALLVKPDTSEALAYGIYDLLRNESLRRQLGKNGHRFVRRHHERSAVARQVCAAYGRALAAVGKKAPLSTDASGNGLAHPAVHRDLVTRSA